MSELTFYTMHLIIDNQSPDKKTLQLAFQTEKENFQYKETHCQISSSYENNNFWMYITSGKLYPYSDTVLNTETETEEKNPRSTKQIEPNKQVFAFYSIDKKTLYISNSKSRPLIESFLNHKIGKKSTVKAFFTDPDDFLEKIKSISKIKFVAKDNLFSHGSEVFNILPEPKDMYGLGMPTTYTLEANFTKAQKTKAFIKNMKDMIKWKNSDMVEHLICIGKDDYNVECIFNVDSLTHKISINLNKDKYGMYDENAVKEALIAKVG